MHFVQPAEGTLDLAFGLGREGMDHFHSQTLHHLAPLREGVVGFEHVPAPDTVTTLHEAKYPQGVNVVAQRHAKALHNSPHRLDTKCMYLYEPRWSRPG